VLYVIYPAATREDVRGDEANQLLDIEFVPLNVINIDLDATSVCTLLHDNFYPRGRRGGGGPLSLLREKKDGSCMPLAQCTGQEGI
jgi:hypothetical protein